MTTTINASPTNGIVQTADGSGVMKLQSNGVTTNAIAWVNAQSNGTVNASYNVSSVTALTSGIYKVAFTNATTDANYCYMGLPTSTASGDRGNVLASTNSIDNASVTSPSTASFCYRVQNPAASLFSEPHMVVVFGN